MEESSSETDGMICGAGNGLEDDLGEGESPCWRRSKPSTAPVRLSVGHCCRLISRHWLVVCAARFPSVFIALHLVLIMSAQ
jgi:hypothetical protein